MVLRVRREMVVPLSVHAGVNGCALASRLQFSRDLYLAMEKSKGGVDNGLHGGRDSGLGWLQNMSGSSMSSIDSSPAGEQPYGQSDMNVPLFRRGRLGVTTSESDEDFMTDSVHDFTGKKSKRQLAGGTTSSLNVDEGDPEAGLVTNRDFPVYFEGGPHFPVRISPVWLASARKVSFGVDDINQSNGSEDAFLPIESSSSNLVGDVSSCKTLNDAESLPYFRYQAESYPGSCYVDVGSVVTDHGSSPSDDGKDPSSRVKFMCSFGGKIFPRPVDGRLRYVGGDTKIIAVNRDTNFVELLAKMTEVYGQALTLKYQLPDEDLDALVSVSTDEDLENMMDEYDKLEKSDGSSRLRVFLFPALDYDTSSHHSELVGDSRNSEQRYVDAVNGISESGSRNRLESYVGSVPSFTTEGLVPLDSTESWSMPRAPDPLPIAVLAHDVGSLIHRVPVAVPLTSITNPIANRSNAAPSAPSSAPSSPPLLPRPALGKLPVVTDMHLSYHPETHMKMGTPYNVLLGEANYQENESFGGSGASSGSQHDLLYRSNDSRRGTDSPPRRQHDSGHPDHALWADQRRHSEMKVPRVGSHGKLTRLVEHVELVPAAGESQQLGDVHLPPVEIQRLLQQQQQHQSLHQPVWQHSIDSQPESYRRVDMPQSSLTPGYQHQPLVFRAGHMQGLPPHEGVYRQGDQQQQFQDEHMLQVPRSLSSHALSSGFPSVQPSYHVGSDPSSPRLGFREVSQRHVQGPQLPPHWPYSGGGFSQQSSYGRRLNYGDQSGRSFRVSNSPPKHRDVSSLADTVRLRNQQQQQSSLANAEGMHLEHVPMATQLSYDPNPGVQPYDLMSRPQMPMYKGFNPFHELNETRSMQLPQQEIDSQFLSGQQQQLHPLQSVEHIVGNSRYQETQVKVPDYDSDEVRQGFRGRPRARVSDDELPVDTGASHNRGENYDSNFPGLHLPESSDDLLPKPMGDFTLGHGKIDRLDQFSSGFQFRPAVPPPNHMGVYPGIKSRSNFTDSSALPWYMSRTTESEYLAASGLRASGNVQDVLPPVFEGNSLQHTPASSAKFDGNTVHQLALGPIFETSALEQTPATGANFEVNGLQQTPAIGQALLFSSTSHRLMEERPGPSGRNPITMQMQNASLIENTMTGSDMIWNGGFEPEDVRKGVPVDNTGSLYEGKLQGLASVSCSTNVPNLFAEDGGEPLVQSYSTQCMTGSIMNEGVMNPYAVDEIPVTGNPFPTGIPTGIFNFDTFRTGSTTEYSPVANNRDLPKNKTNSTQVPSLEGDDSGRSTKTVTSSNHSPSHSSCGDIFLGHLTMTQHLAEDMASCVLESSLSKAGSQVLHKEEDNLDVVQGLEMWPLEPAPTLSPNLWENALDEAVSTKGDNEDNDERLATEEISEQHSKKLTVGITKSEDPEVFQGSLVESPEIQEKSTVKNASATAADEAIAHGLQTIKNADLEELRELGSGTFGTVYHGKWRGTDVAIKRIKASCFSGRPSEQDRMIADFWREACNLGILHHPNVVAFYGVVSDGPGGTLATVTEYMVNGSLKQVLQKKDRTIDRRKRLMIAMDSAFGMEYLHGKNIVHFDLKCENLLVNMRDPHRPICKVGDLGLSKVKHQTMVSGGVRGTLPWMAPELLNGNSGLVTEKVDVFSFGIVMWELLTGEEPYANMHYGAIIGGIVNNTLRPPIPSWCDPAWRSLMERCWSADPANRPPFSEISSELRAMSESLKPKPHPHPHAHAQGQHPS